MIIALALYQMRETILVQLNHIAREKKSLYMITDEAQYISMLLDSGNTSMNSNRKDNFNPGVTSAVPR